MEAENQVQYFDQETKATLLTDLETEFQKFAEDVYRTIREENQQRVKSNKIGPEQVDGIVSSRRARYESLDLKAKVSALTSNFYLLWPGGDYRQRIVDNKDNGGGWDLLNDLDNVLKEKGFDKLNDLVLEKNTEGIRSDTRALVIGDVFLEMLSRGYDRELLRRGG